MLGEAVEEDSGSLGQTVSRKVAVPASPRCEQGAIPAVGRRYHYTRARQQRPTLDVHRPETPGQDIVCGQEPVVHCAQESTAEQSAKENEVQLHRHESPVLRSALAEEQGALVSEESTATVNRHAKVLSCDIIWIVLWLSRFESHWLLRECIPLRVRKY